MLHFRASYSVHRPWVLRTEYCPPQGARSPLTAGAFAEMKPRRAVLRTPQQEVLSDRAGAQKI